MPSLSKLLRWIGAMIPANFLKFLEFLFFQFSSVDAAVINDSIVSLIRAEPIPFIAGLYASVSLIKSRLLFLNIFFILSIDNLELSRYLSTLFNSSTKNLRSYFPIAESIFPIPISGNAFLYLLSIL